MATTTQYKIKPGDTLSGIASANKTTVSELAKLNNIADVNKISAGANINIAPVSTPTIQPQVPAPTIGTKPVTVQSPTPPTAAPGLAQTITSGIESIKSEREKEIADREKTNQDYQSSIADTFSSLAGLPQEREQILKDEGSDEAKKQVDEFTSKLEAEQLSNRRRRDEILGNGGMTRAQAAAAVNEEDRISVSKQADIAILQNAALRRYDTAQEIADRQIEMKTENLRLRLDGLKFFYQENKDQLTKQQDRQYNEAIKEADREYEKTYEKEKILSSTKLDLVKAASMSGAPSSVLSAIQNARTPEDAIMRAGRYGLSIDDKLKQAQLTKALQDVNGTPEEKAKVENLTTVAQLLNGLKSTSSGYKGAVGAGFQKFIPGFLKGGSKFIAGSKPAGYEATFNQLKDTLALGNIDKLKGAMSDKDIEFLRNTATKLSLGMSEEEFSKELTNMSNRVVGQLGTLGVDTSVLETQNLSNEDLLKLPTQTENNKLFFTVKGSL